MFFKKIIHFLRGVLDASFSCGGFLGTCPVRFPNLPLLRDDVNAIARSIGFTIASLTFFLPMSLIIMH